MDSNRHQNTVVRGPGTGLLIIDVQEKFRPAIDGFDQIVENIVRLVLGFQLFRMPVLVTEQYPKGLGNTVELIRAQFPLLEITEKMEFACTMNEAFINRLNKQNVKNIVVCGVESHVCVNQTVHGLLKRGYTVHVVADAIGSRNESDHAMALNKMFASGAIAATTEMTLFELAERAGTESFKLIQKMVKSRIRQPQPLDVGALDGGMVQMRSTSASSFASVPTVEATRKFDAQEQQSLAGSAFDTEALVSGESPVSESILGDGTDAADDETRHLDRVDLPGLDGPLSEPEITV